MERGLNDAADLCGRNTRDAARAWGVFLEPRHAQGEESFAPQLHGGSRNLQLFGDLLTRHSVSRHGHDLCALNDAQGKALRMCPCDQRRSFCGREENRWSQMHGAKIALVGVDCQSIYDALH